MPLLEQYQQISGYAAINHTIFMQNCKPMTFWVHAFMEKWLIFPLIDKNNNNNNNLIKLPVTEMLYF